jgi:hypothetical protein
VLIVQEMLADLPRNDTCGRVRRISRARTDH